MLEWLKGEKTIDDVAEDLKLEFPKNIERRAIAFRGQVQRRQVAGTSASAGAGAASLKGETDIHKACT